MTLAIADLVRDEELQTRVRCDERIVREYAALLKSGTTFPPVLVYSNETEFWLADGYHRVSARERNGDTTVLAEVRRGTRIDAVWAACAANQTHGLMRSNADKRRAVDRALKHPRSHKLSDRQIAHHCGVHHFTVSRYRRKLENSGEIREINVRLARRRDSDYPLSITRIKQSNMHRGASFRAGCDDVAIKSRLATIASLAAKLHCELQHLLPLVEGRCAADPEQSLREALIALSGQLNAIRDEVNGAAFVPR